ncbi:mycofactocin biosynthesis peptidyl-dipeptidase MftE [Streptomyces sp. NPDC048251]|uniref:mycofactocin biosynthesis peptidyl-dipeptidase MftE n=1 Tax=Streptomyces sp. NPDC048251 TaxID=3154501 RepID=UPI00342CA7CA
MADSRDDARAPNLSDLTWPEAETLSRAGALLAVPVGSTEQHGPHLPLSTDTDIAVALCDWLARHRRGVVVAPPLAYGSSGEHDGFAGTLSIGQEALEHVLVELVRSATRAFAHVLLVSAHGGNADTVRRAVARLRGESRDVRAFMPSWDGEPHAGRAETALQLALAPHRVHEDRAEPGDTRPLKAIWPLLTTRGVRAVSANGVLGDPTGATAAEGRALLDRLTADLLRESAAWYPVPADADFAGRAPAEAGR